MPIPLRPDFDAGRVRRVARASKDANQVRRLLALAAIYGCCSTRPAGTSPLSSSCRVTSRSFRCRRSAPNSTPRRMSGSSCARTGSPTACSWTSMTSWITAAKPGTNWKPSLGGLCRSACAIGRTGSDQGGLASGSRQAIDKGSGVECDHRPSSAFGGLPVIGQAVAGRAFCRRFRALLIAWLW